MKMAEVCLPLVLARRSSKITEDGVRKRSVPVVLIFNMKLITALSRSFDDMPNI